MIKVLRKDGLGRDKMAYVLGKEDLEVGADSASDIDGHRHLARTQPHNWLVLLQLDSPDTSLGSICLLLIEVFVKNLAPYFVDRSQSLFYFVPQEKNIAVKLALGIFQLLENM